MQRESELLLKNLHIFWGENNDVLMVLVGRLNLAMYLPAERSTLGQKEKKMYRFHNGHFIAVGRVPTYFFSYNTQRAVSW